MKRNNSIVDDWVKDFRLNSPIDGSICFKARIQYETNRFFRQLESEVHVVHVNNKNLTLFYLLDPDVERFHIPDMLYFNPAQFIYHPRLAFEVTGNYDSDAYHMLITPVERWCNDATIRELVAKTNN